MLIHRPPVAPRGALPFLKNAARRRRIPAQRNAVRTAIAWTAENGNEPAQQVLRNTLRSACELIGAERGFTLQTRDEAMLEVTSAHQIRQDELLDAVLGRAAQALHHALTCGELGLADRQGLALPEAACGSTPFVVALPLELGARRHGALCLLRAGTPRTLSELDVEILGALADQAALAMRAANQHSALSKLAASLSAHLEDCAPQIA